LYFCKKCLPKVLSEMRGIFSVIFKKQQAMITYDFRHTGGPPKNQTQEYFFLLLAFPQTKTVQLNYNSLSFKPNSRFGEAVAGTNLIKILMCSDPTRQHVIFQLMCINIFFQDQYIKFLGTHLHVDHCQLALHK
jgi:hypothetical protein